MSLESYRKELLKVDQPRKTTIKNSYGVYDAYKYYRKNKPKAKEYIISESQYFSIIRTLNLLLCEEILNQKDIVFPLAMGRVEVRKYTPEVKFDKDGKIKTSYPIDWDSTIRLWYEDDISRKKKLILKKKEKEVFRIGYNKSHARYKNKEYYEFKVNRALKLSLRDVIREGDFDAFSANRL